MDSGAVTIKKGKLGKLKFARQRLLQRYEHQLLVSCLVGLYSCRWRWYQQRKVEPGKWCCTKWECAFYPVLAAAFCFSFAFLYLWGEAKNDYNSFDWFSYTNLGVWFLWSNVLLVLAAISFSYILLLLVNPGCVPAVGRSAAVYALLPQDLDRVHFGLLHFRISSNHSNVEHTMEDGHLVIADNRSLFACGRHLLHGSAVLASGPVYLPVEQKRYSGSFLQVTVLVPYLALLFFLFFIPLAMYSPCIQEEGTLGPKPALIGHRGAPMVAPENTLMAFVKTVEHEGDGLETDVRISFDGVPFLMHDKTLTRTTNIHEVHPDRANESAAMFTWDVLSTLNSGKWFFENKPFYNMPVMSDSDSEWAEQQSIYKLNDLLQLAEQDNKLVLFDLHRPPEEHPYRETWIHRTLEVILTESKIQPHLVLWLENIDRSYVQSVAPGFQQTFRKKAPLEVLRSEKIVKLNLNYREMSSEDIRKYAEANITTNLYVVNEPWLFSLAWCAGAHSVTTDAVHTLGKVEKPFFLMTPRNYQIMWILTDVLSGIFISLVFLLHWWREKGTSCYSGNSAEILARGPYSTFGTNLNAMPRMPTVA